MTSFKKLTAVFLTLIMAVCCFGVQVSAVSVYDKASKLSPMEFASGNFRNTTEYYFKITLTDSGYIKFYCSDIEYTELTLLNTNGNTIVNADIVHSSSFDLGKEFEISKKGTYYLKLEKDSFAFDDYSAHFKNFYYGFRPEHEPKVTLALNVKVGDKLDFSALTSNYDGKCTWKTTDSKVASVKSGTVTCKKAGKAKIRLYSDDGDYSEITLVVKKK